MKCPEETRQKLWELLYDLLSPEEAEALRAQITSDPAVARAYSEAKLRADLLAAAAKREEPKLPLGIPGANDKFELGDAPAAAETSRASLAKVVSILASLAALLLVAVAGFGFVRWGTPGAAVAARNEREDLAQRYVRIKVTGPQVVTPSDSNSYLVNTLATDGTPVSTDLIYRILAPNGTVQFEEQQKTDDNGLARITVPGDSVAGRGSLEVETDGEEWSEKLQSDLYSRSSSFEDATPSDTAKWYVAKSLKDSRQPVEFDLRTQLADNLIVTAQNEGKQVGQQSIAAIDELDAKKSTHSSLALPAKVSGPTWLTLYDTTASPPTPLGEQFFFIPSQHKLAIVRADPVEVYAPGDEVALQFQVSGEEGKPQAAELRLAIVEESALAEDERLAENRDLSVEFFSQSRHKVQAEGSPDDDLVVLSYSAPPASPPLVLDNSTQVNLAYEQALAELDWRREARLRLVGQVLLVGGGLLFAGLVLLALMRLATSARVLVPTLSAAAGCALVGALWMTAHVNDEGDLVTAAASLGRKSSRTATEHVVAINDQKQASPAAADPTASEPVALGVEEDGVKGITDSTHEAGIVVDNPVPSKPSEPAPTAPEPVVPAETPAPAKEMVKDGLLGKKPDSSAAGGLGGFGGGTTGLAPGGLGGGGGGGGFRTGGPTSGSGSVDGGGLGGLGAGPPFGMTLHRDALAVPTVYANAHLASGEDGRSTVSFTLPTKPGVYRVFVEGRSGEQLGLYRGKLTVREMPPEKEE